MRSTTVRLLALLSSVGCADQVLSTPVDSTPWLNNGLSLSLQGNVLHPQGSGWSMNALIENHTGKTIKFGPPGCRGLETLRHGQWLVAQPEPIACEAVREVLLDGQSLPFSFTVPNTPGIYRQVVGAYATDDQAYLVRSEPVTVR